MRGIIKYGIVAVVAVLLSAFAVGRTGLELPGLVLPTPYRLNYPSYFGNRTNFSDDNPLTVEGVALGRRLFYEKRLSRTSTISCASCHRQARAFTDGRAFSVGFDGTPTKRNSMSLANLLWVRNFFWDGRANSLEAQAMVPLTDPHEMGQSMDSSVAKLRVGRFYDSLFIAAFGPGGDAVATGGGAITADRIARALGQFERTLISADAPYDRYIRGEYQLTAEERAGLLLFFGRARCENCHGGPKTFDETFHNNGLDREPKDPGRAGVTGMGYDRGRFRVVTLRNIALTGPYMHDGRFNTLEEVIDHYNEHVEPGKTLSPTLRDTSNMPVRLRLSVAEKKELVAFLRSLTDSTFITDKKFADPFVNTK
jgi:cytochrome c peroxidase